MDSAEAWLSEHDPDYAETKQAWKHLDGKYYTVPREESIHGLDEPSVEDLIESGLRAVQGVPTRACEVCGEAFEAERRDGNHQKYCGKKCRKQAEYRRWRFRESNV